MGIDVHIGDGVLRSGDDGWAVHLCESLILWDMILGSGGEDVGGMVLRRGGTWIDGSTWEFRVGLHA